MKEPLGSIAPGGFPLLLLLLLMLPGLPGAQERRDMGGWETDSPYNRLYDASEMDRWKGVVEKTMEVVPLPGMAPGMALLIRDRGGDLITVHLGPLWFLESENIGFRKGDQVKVKGVWVEIAEQDVFVASKIKKGEHYEYKIRLTKDGTPFWTMTPEQLAMERAGQ